MDANTKITKRCKVCNETKDILEFPKGRMCKACVKIREGDRVATHVKRNRLQLHYKQVMSILYTFVKIYEQKPRNKIDFDCLHIDCKRLLKILNEEDEELQ
jgi:hypothetical protein